MKVCQIVLAILVSESGDRDLNRISNDKLMRISI
jgi:hypothetical protein